MNHLKNQIQNYPKHNENDIIYQYILKIFYQSHNHDYQDQLHNQIFYIIMNSNWINEFHEIINVFDTDEKIEIYNELLELVEKIKKNEPRSAHTLKGTSAQLGIIPIEESAKNINNNINVNENIDIILGIMNEIEEKNLFQID